MEAVEDSIIVNNLPFGIAWKAADCRWRHWSISAGSHSESFFAQNDYGIHSGRAARG
jgi:hypothetical protein